MRGLEAKDFEIRNSGELVRPEGDVMMVAIFANDTSAETRSDLFLAEAIFSEPGKPQVKQAREK
jgi:hypothetical protein